MGTVYGLLTALVLLNSVARGCNTTQFFTKVVCYQRVQYNTIFYKSGVIYKNWTWIWIQKWINFSANWNLFFSQGKLRQLQETHWKLLRDSQKTRNPTCRRVRWVNMRRSCRAEVDGVIFSDSDSVAVPKFLNPDLVPRFVQIWESESCSDSRNHRCNRNSAMFELKQWHF